MKRFDAGFPVLGSGVRGGGGTGADVILISHVIILICAEILCVDLRTYHCDTTVPRLTITCIPWIIDLLTRIHRVSSREIDATNSVLSEGSIKYAT